MGRIVMPQALRIAIPPMTSWHLNTIKNSSLGVAIGYPEFVSVVDTVISQTGQAIEGVGLIVATFLLLSLSLSFVTGRYARQLGWSVARQPGRSIQSAPQLGRASGRERVGRYVEIPVVAVSLQNNSRNHLQLSTHMRVYRDSIK